MKRHAGFTLIEILVALAVIAMALTALLGASGQATRNAAELRDRTYAGWVAQNVLTELRVSDEPLDTGTRNGEEMLAGERWIWSAEISAAAVPLLRHILIRVGREDGDESIVTLSAFRLTEPPQRQQQPPPGTP